MIDILKGITATALYRPFILLFTITFLTLSSINFPLGMYDMFWVDPTYDLGS